MSGMTSFVFLRPDSCSCLQLIPQSAVLIQGLAASVQTGLQMSGCVRMLCPAVPRDDRTSVFAGQWEAYDPARDGQGNKGVTQVLSLYSKLVKTPLIDCSANTLIYVLS